MKDTENIFELGSFILLSSKCWGANKKIPKQVLAELTNSDDDELNTWVKSNKDLIDKDGLFDIRSRITKARNTIDAVALPSPLEGFSFVPKETIPSLAAELDSIIADFNDVADDFSTPEKYEKKIEKAKKILSRRKLFNRKDYPVNIRDKFHLGYRIIEFTVPGQLKTISPKIYKEEMEKFKKLVEETRNEAVIFLREAFLEVVTHITTVLTGEQKDGEPRRIRQDTLDKLENFFSEFKTKNVFKDKELTGIIDEARDVMFGLNASDLRDSGKLRKRIGKQMEKVGDVLEKSITKYKRSISLD